MQISSCDFCSEYRLTGYIPKSLSLQNTYGVSYNKHTVKCCAKLIKESKKFSQGQENENEPETETKVGMNVNTKAALGENVGTRRLYSYI